MKILDPGHTYEVDNVVEGTQTLLFIKKAAVEGDPEGTLRTVQDGTTNEEILAVLVDRLQFLYDKLPDVYTMSALNHCREALVNLEVRTKERQARKVEGTDQA